jgi:hypothetical protein
MIGILQGGLDMQRSGFGLWLGALCALVALGVAVPYGVLAGQPGWGVAVFWGLFGVAVIAVIAAGVRGWRVR